MRTLVIASQKGGVGKSTIAGHLGVMAESKGAGPVALIDTDPQGSLASWWNERKSETPIFASVDVGKIAEHMEQPHRAKITGEAAISLSQHGTVAPVTLYQRTDFAASMIDGRTVQEIDATSRSADEIEKLWKYVAAQLRKNIN